ncbi:Short-chain dehydrogenase/reductase family 16C member 6 [Daldinia childiae]|uniref:Short-chain dehydrogenase/reductase family 16C member 6 n=1 Tax=Daldinia childiae TaxID=326645 RepID=UPI001445EE66|nr:Short-chain dehydrogenase/reductase family 16C member 6 [Daldinia childiae]KAF3070723.1 Short-chain dehydrogenase/reductase family 16C member 6 [Daldinia childiae]
MDHPQPSAHESWWAPISVDVLLKVLNVTLLHPFVAWIIPLCFRAEHQAWNTNPMVVSIVWATFVTFLWMGNVISHKIAYGMHREVDLTEEVIVITGGASGLGLLIAEVYGMRGATIAVLDTAELESTEARGITYYKCDVRDKAQIARVATEIERDLGTPTVLINNAAEVVGKKLLDMDLEEVEKSITTNLLSHFYTIKTFLPGMIRNETGGTIVTLSSVIGHLGAARLTDYAAAKAGVTALHKSLAAELQEYPEIKTILVTPGQLSTPLFYGVKTPNPFIAPVVEPIEVAKEIIKAIDLGLSDHIGMPLYARWVDWYNVLPVGLQKIARRISGVDSGMTTFIGRRGTQLSEKNGHLI